MMTGLLLAAALLQAEGELPFEVEYRDGLRVRTRDDVFELRVTGRVFAQLRVVDDRPADTAAPLRSVPDTVSLRQARLEFEATLQREWVARFSFELTSGTFDQSLGEEPSSVTATLRDGYLAWRRFREFEVRIGQFLIPVGQEALTPIRLLEWLERSPMDRLTPGRDLGFMVAGELDGGSLDYALAASNGGTYLAQRSASVVARIDGWELGARVRARPFLRSGVPILEMLRLAVSGSFGNHGPVPVVDFDLISTELSVLWLDSTAPGAFDGNRWRLLPALWWAAGPVGLQAEMLFREDELDGSFAGSRLVSRGWWAGGSVWLTGEEKVPDARPRPLNEWGAVELVLRFGRVSVRNALAAGLAVPGQDAEGVSSLTLGLNWWVTPHVRFSVNGVREGYSAPLTFDARQASELYGILLRAAIDF